MLSLHGIIIQAPSLCTPNFEMVPIAPVSAPVASTSNIIWVHLCCWGLAGEELGSGSTE